MSRYLDDFMWVFVYWICYASRCKNTYSCEAILSKLYKLKEKAALKENIIKMKDILFPNILVQV